MNLAGILQEECIAVHVGLTDKESVLKYIARLAVKNPLLSEFDEKKIYQSLLDREKLGSTGFSNQIAIPHCALEGLKDFVLGILTVANGIAFGSLDDQLTRVFFFIIAPADQRTRHLRILSTISRYLRTPENVSKLILAQDPRAVRESVLRHTLAEDDLEKQDNFKLIQVVIQKKERFEEILNIFTGIEDGYFYVIEGQNAAQYLYRMPLFSMFWSESQQRFNQVIVALVDKKMVNEIAQKIKNIITELGKEPDILFMVQDIFFWHGSLSI